MIDRDGNAIPTDVLARIEHYVKRMKACEARVAAAYEAYQRATRANEEMRCYAYKAALEDVRYEARFLTAAADSLFQPAAFEDFYRQTHSSETT